MRGGGAQPHSPLKSTASTERECTKTKAGSAAKAAIANAGTVHLSHCGT